MKRGPQYILKSGAFFFGALFLFHSHSSLKADDSAHDSEPFDEVVSKPETPLYRTGPDHLYRTDGVGDRFRRDGGRGGGAGPSSAAEFATADLSQFSEDQLDSMASSWTDLFGGCRSWWVISFRVPILPQRFPFVRCIRLQRNIHAL
jgi:hypothetical protein